MAATIESPEFIPTDEQIQLSSMSFGEMVYQIEVQTSVPNNRSALVFGIYRGAAIYKARLLENKLAELTDQGENNGRN